MCLVSMFVQSLPFIFLTLSPLLMLDNRQRCKCSPRFPKPLCNMLFLMLLPFLLATREHRRVSVKSFRYITIYSRFTTACVDVDRTIFSTFNIFPLSLTIFYFNLIKAVWDRKSQHEKLTSSCSRSNEIKLTFVWPNICLTIQQFNSLFFSSLMMLVGRNHILKWHIWERKIASDSDIEINATSKQSQLTMSLGNEIYQIIERNWYRLKSSGLTRCSSEQIEFYAHKLSMPSQTYQHHRSHLDNQRVLPQHSWTLHWVG